MLRCLAYVLWMVVIACGFRLPGQARVADQAALPAAPPLMWDVVSIREALNGDTSYIDNPPRTCYYHGERIAAWGMMLNAYDVKLANLLKGLPEWAFSTRYNLTAKCDAAGDLAIFKLSDQESYAAKNVMLKAMLADRFKLQIHAETRQARTYELVKTERAAKLMVPVSDKDAGPISSCNTHFSQKGMEVDSTGCPFSIFFSQLQQTLGTNVLDRTGMAGKYVYHLMWSMPRATSIEGEELYPAIVDAVRALGLELKETKGPVTFWVVDHIEKPTAN